jgi:hypothetical protein
LILGIRDEVGDPVKVGVGIWLGISEVLGASLGIQSPLSQHVSQHAQIISGAVPPQSDLNPSKENVFAAQKTGSRLPVKEVLVKYNHSRFAERLLSSVGTDPERPLSSRKQKVNVSAQVK